MARKQPEAQAAGEDPRRILQHAIELAEDDLAKATKARTDALRTVAADPASATRAVRTADKQVEDARQNLQVLQEALEHAELAAAEAARAASIEASKADRETVVRLADARVALAAEIDAAFDVLAEAVGRYVANGRTCAALVQRALTTRYSGDIQRQQDALCTILPRASGTGADVAGAVANRMRKLIETLDAPTSATYVRFNDFMPIGMRVRDAATADRRDLAIRMEVSN